MVFLWVQNKNDPKITKRAKQCNALAPAGPLLALSVEQLLHRSIDPAPITRNKTGHKNRPKKTRCFAPGYLLAHALTQQLALRAAAYTQRRHKYFELNAQCPLDKSTHDIM